MKTLFTTLVLTLLIASAAMAQPLKIGLRGGVNTGNYNFSRFDMDGTSIMPVTTMGTGYQIALVTRLSIPKFLQIQPELVYSVRDYGYNLVSDAGVKRVNISSKRMEIPLLVGFNISALRFFGGPVFTLSSSESSNKKSSNFKVKYNTSDVALQVGAGLDIKKFFLDVRYTTNLKSTYHTFTLNDQSHKGKIKSEKLWSFNVGFFF